MGIVESVGRAISLLIDGSEFDFAPDLDFSRLKGKRILVVPSSGTREISDRRFTLRTVETSICLVVRATVDDASEYLEELEGIAKLVQRSELADDNGILGTVTKAVYDPIYDAGMLRTSHVFFGIVSVTMVITRAD